MDKLRTTTIRVLPESTSDLLNVINKFNEACNWLSEFAFCHECFNWYRLQTRTYHQLRDNYGLTSHQANVAIHKVTAAYKKNKDQIIIFRSPSMPLYRHSYKRTGQVLIYGTRYNIKARDDIELSSKQQATLSWHNGKFLIHQVISSELSQPYEAQDYLGCDLGITNILTDHTGYIYAGGQINGLRHRHARLRSKLQSKGTRSAKRLLNKRSKKESLFARAVNHLISKRIVTKAYDALLGIALEDLKGIKERIKVKKAQRRQHHAWSFHQLRRFIEYKAAEKGVPVVFVDPRNTSRTCPQCGCIDKRNRPTQSQFKCISCGYAGHADTIAAINISRRADGIQPDATPDGELQVLKGQTPTRTAQEQMLRKQANCVPNHQ